MSENTKNIPDWFPPGVWWTLRNRIGTRFQDEKDEILKLAQDSIVEAGKVMIPPIMVLALGASLAPRPRPLLVPLTSHPVWP